MDITKSLLAYDDKYHPPRLVRTTQISLRQDGTMLDIQYVKAYVVRTEVYDDYIQRNRSAFQVI